MGFDIKTLSPNLNFNKKFLSGYYYPKNPDKYIGDINKIIYRSSYERKFCIFCDLSEDVIKWSSEPFSINYYNPFDRKMHEYFIDFFVRIKVNDKFEDYLIEIKPRKKLIKPEPPKNNNIRNLEKYNNLLKEYLINLHKFDAAKDFAEKNGYKYKILTENEIFNFLNK